MDNDFFWWLDATVRSLEFEDAKRQTWAAQVTGASRRQERLQARDEVLQKMGEEHEDESMSEEPTKSLPHEHQTAMSAAPPYQENSESVHSFPDGWAVKKTKTFGDLTYEGRMMTNCIREDGEGQGGCGNCEGSGNCPYCEDGYTECSECYGNGKHECSECGGAGNFECGRCNNEIAKYEKCRPCEGKGKDALGNACGWCNESGKYGVVISGKVECSECGGEGKDEDGDLCYACDGEGVEDCDDCGGSGTWNCDECEGEGSKDCEYCDEGSTYCGSCEGSGECYECGGSGGDKSGGPSRYYMPYTDEEASNFQRAPHGAYSLRDPDNIPHVSFLHTDEAGQKSELDAHDILGRENTIPKVPYQHRILDYLKGKLKGRDSCDTCDGKGETDSLTWNDCGTCHRSGRVFNPDNGAPGECGDCKGAGVIQGTEKRSCLNCDGTGKPAVRVGWGYGSTRERYTEGDINNILSGSIPKPDTLLLARHNDEPNRVETLAGVDEAHRFSGARKDSYGQWITKKSVCSGPYGCGGSGHMKSCQADDERGTSCGLSEDASVHLEGHEFEPNICGQCMGKGTTRDTVYGSEGFTLHALPRNAVDDNQLEYRPSDSLWRLKDGRGSKVNWDAEGGGKVDWDTLIKLHESVEDGEEHTEDHRKLRSALPAAAQRLFGTIT